MAPLSVAIVAFAAIVLAALAVIISLTRRHALEQVRTAQLEAQVAEAEAAALRARLQPHLVFNTLHSIAAALRTEPATAERMIVLLGDVLRSSLILGAKSEVSLGDEAAFARSYLELQQLRFSDRLRVEWQIPDALLSARVPPFLLQPLVENSVKHGLEETSNGIIAVSALAANGTLTLRVSDYGRGTPSTRPGLGIGLGSIRERLQKMYGTRASIRLDSTPGRGTNVVVELPLR